MVWLNVILRLVRRGGRASLIDESLGREDEFGDLLRSDFFFFQISYLLLRLIVR